MSHLNPPGRWCWSGRAWLAAFALALAACTAPRATESPTAGVAARQPAAAASSPGSAESSPGSAASVPARALPLALVYRQPGACDGCAESLAGLLEKSGYRTRLITPAELRNKAVFDGVALYAQPGGDSTKQVYDAVGAADWPRVAARVRSFVANGGSYVGICLGGFLAGAWIDDEGTIAAYDLLQGDVDAFTHTKIDHKSDQVVPVTWLLPMQQRNVYFQEGPYFEAKGTVFARYNDGSVATLLATYGKGRVAVSGVHLEAEADWYEAQGLHDPDGPDADLGKLLIDAMAGPLAP